MKRYVCRVCGYEYDPALGDPDSGMRLAPALKICPTTAVCFAG